MQTKIFYSLSNLQQILIMLVLLCLVYLQPVCQLLHFQGLRTFDHPRRDRIVLDFGSNDLVSSGVV